jgi:hypothetical protein
MDTASTASLEVIDRYSYRMPVRPEGMFHVATMCGEILDPAVRASFNPETRCVVVDGVAFRQVEEAPNILREIETAGFRVLHWDIKPAAHAKDQSALLVNATKG